MTTTVPIHPLPEILLLTHGGWGLQLCNSLRMVMGEIEGVTEIALTMNAPIYYERVFSLTGLIEAMQEYGTEKISRVMVGTADDCVIFRTAEDNTWDYQETLMPEIMK